MRTYAFTSTLAALLLAGQAAAQVYRVFPNSVVPPNPAVSDARPIEVGVKFRASLSGEIVALRFYKGVENTGTHIGHLWAGDGTLLATQLFTDETPVGWQEVALSTPVAIQADTTYVASYYSENGWFAADSTGLLAAIDAPPLQLLANGTDGANAVYLYDVSGFPTSFGNGYNYFVDIAFSPAPIVDGTPPTVASTSPASAATGIATSANVVATFSEAIDETTLSAATFELRDATNALVPAALSYETGTHAATLDPTSNLAYTSVYTARVVGGPGGVADLAGNLLAADFVWSFTTGQPAPCMSDAGASDFLQGTTAGTVAAADVSLASGLDEQFPGEALPVGWSATEWNPGGGAVVSDGQVSVDGARLGTDAYFTAGRTLEFRATFAPTPFEHVGFADTLNDAPWAIFSTGGAGTGLAVRTNSGAGVIDTPIALPDPFATHDFRIVWTAGQVEYAVDGVVLATHPIATVSMRPLASDFTTGSGAISLESLRLIPPYLPAGTFTSRVGDAGQVASWGALEWTSSTPAPTSLGISVRTGLTPTPDGSWSAFAPIAASGTPVGQIGRYLQYRADLATSDAEQTPRLSEIRFACTAAATCGNGVREFAEECDDGNTQNGDGCSATCAYESTDADGDGLSNVDELALGTDPLNPDTDTDGLSDGAEVAAGTNPLVADTDGDGVLDGAEIAGGTNPLLADTDGDGLNDGAEITHGTNPLVGDTDGDGVLDGAEVSGGTNPIVADTDGDGLNDGAEITHGTNPLVGDTDGDGLLDGAEVTGGTSPLDADTDADGFCDGPASPTPGACVPGDNCRLVANPEQSNLDQDLAGDVCDNCPFEPNSDQADTGGVFASSPDGIGDACQCGDVSDALLTAPDGGVTAFDRDAVRLYLAGAGTQPVAPLVQRCGVAGTAGACTVLDSTYLARAQTLGSALLPSCRAGACLANPADLDGDCLIGTDLCLGWPTSAAAQSSDANGDTVPDSCQCGDLDGDGDVDLADEARLGACIVGEATCDASLADFDRNGAIDAADGAIYEAARDSDTLSSLGCTRKLGPAGP